MSHMVTVSDVKVTWESVKKVAAHLGLRIAEGVSQYLGGNTATGNAIYLPNWQKPVIFQKDGSYSYDNYLGNWGNISELNKVIGLSIIDMNGEDISGVTIKQIATDEIIFETR